MSLSLLKGIHPVYLTEYYFFSWTKIGDDFNLFILEGLLLLVMRIQLSSKGKTRGPSKRPRIETCKSPCLHIDSSQERMRVSYFQFFWRRVVAKRALDIGRARVHSRHLDPVEWASWIYFYFKFFFLELDTLFSSQRNSELINIVNTWSKSSRLDVKRSWWSRCILFGFLWEHVRLKYTPIQILKVCTYFILRSMSITWF